MNQINKFTGGICFLLLGITIFSTGSCKKENARTVTEQQTKDKPIQLRASTASTNVQQLLDAMYQEGGTEAEVDATLEAFQALGVEELNEYISLRKDKLAQRITLDTTIDEQERALRMQQNEAATGFAIDVNSLSQQRYGHGWNKITGEQMDTLGKEVLQSNSNYGILTLPANYNSGENSIQGCYVASYPNNVYKVWGWGRMWYGYTSRRTPNTSDCDYEFRFDGYYRKICPRDGNTTALIKWFGNNLKTRYFGFWDGTDTFVLIGARGVWIVCNGPWNVWAGATY